MPRTLLLHIGFPKTGTTFLQRYTFGQYQGQYLQTPGKGHKPLQRLLTETTMEGGPEIWEKGNVGHQRLTAVFEAPDSDLKIFSNEHWLFGPLSMSPDRKKQRPSEGLHHVTQHLKALSKVLARDFGVTTKAVVTFRRQASYLTSFYAQHADRFSCPVGQAHFEKVVDETLNDPGLNAHGFLDYHRLYTDLCDTLGRENVGVLFFEELSQPNFWAELGQTIDGTPLAPPPNLAKPVNKKASATKGQWTIRKPPRLLSKLTRRVTVKIDKKTGTALTDKIARWEQIGQPDNTFSLPPELGDRITQAFSASNLALRDALGRADMPSGYVTEPV